MMRLFLAIELSEDVRNHLMEVRRRLEGVLPKISYTRGENFHLTLKFLGEVEPKKVAAITESLAMIKPRPIELAASRMEYFPNRGPIKIVTAALDGTIGPLCGLVEGIEQRCRFLGFEKEQRAYRPHVTIGRARPVLSGKFRVTCDEATAEMWPGPMFAPAEFVLMESQLGAEGSKYSVVARFEIGG